MAIKLHTPELVAADCGDALAALAWWATARHESSQPRRAARIAGSYSSTPTGGDAAADGRRPFFAHERSGIA